MLTEGESKRKYHRKRLAQSFCSPKEQPKPKKHSPDFGSVSWDTEALQATLESWPTETPINWSAVGRAHGIQGGNAGQVAREFAEERELDVEDIMSSTPKRKRTIRPCKRKLPGSDISIPSNPPIHIIEAEIKSMISSGRFTLGEECAPYKITKYTLVDGMMTPQDTFVQARKVPLNEIRQRILDKHLKYETDTFINSHSYDREGKRIHSVATTPTLRACLMNSCASFSLSLRDPDPYACGMITQPF